MRRKIPEHFKRDWSSNDPVRMDGAALVHAQGRPWRIVLAQFKRRIVDCVFGGDKIKERWRKNKFNRGQIHR